MYPDKNPVPEPITRLSHGNIGLKDEWNFFLFFNFNFWNGFWYLSKFWIVDFALLKKSTHTFFKYSSLDDSHLIICQATNVQNELLKYQAMKWWSNEIRVSPSTYNFESVWLIKSYYCRIALAQLLLCAPPHHPISFRKLPLKSVNHVMKYDFFFQCFVSLVSLMNFAIFLFALMCKLHTECSFGHCVTKFTFDACTVSHFQYDFSRVDVINWVRQHCCHCTVQIIHKYIHHMNSRWHILQ